MTHQLFPEAVDFESAKCADDYPYGFTLRCKMYFWIEFKKGKGYRCVQQSENPKNGVMNKEKKGTYSFLPIYVGLNPDNGYFEFVHTPENLNYGSDFGQAVKKFIQDYWPQLPEGHKSLFKTFYSYMVSHSQEYYAENGLTLDNLNEFMGW